MLHIAQVSNKDLQYIDYFKKLSTILQVDEMPLFFQMSETLTLEISYHVPSLLSVHIVLSYIQQSRYKMSALVQDAHSALQKEKAAFQVELWRTEVAGPTT
jgi:hypothetical protein